MRKYFPSYAHFFPLFIAMFFLCIFTGCMTTHVPRGNVEALAKYMIKENQGLWDGAVASVQDVRAVSGFSIEVAGKQVFFYEFDDKRKKGQEKLKSIKEKGYLYILGFKFNAVVNGRFVMVDYDRNPKAKELLETFMAF